MSVRRLLGGFALLSGATAVTQLMGFIALAIAARRLGPEHLGAASFVLAIAVYFTIPTNFGLTLLATREIAAAPERRREVIGEVLILRAAIGLTAVGVLLLATPLLASDPETRRLLPLAALAVLADLVVGEWALMGLDRPKPVALARLLGQGVYGVLVVVALGSGEDGARQLILFSALSILIVAAVSLAIVAREAGLPRLRSSIASARRRVGASAPFGWGSILLQVYLGAGTILLGYLATTREVGEYAVAQKIPAALLAQVGLWAVTLYAHAARMGGSEPEQLRAHVDRVVGLSVMVALPLGVGGSLCGGDVIVRLFGDQYDAAGTPFALLLWALAIAAVNVHFGAVLGAAGDERRYAINIAGGTVLCIGVGLALTPALGTSGPAIGVIVAELAILALMGARYVRVVGPLSIDRSELAAVAGATALMGGILVALGDLEVLVRVAAGAVVYGGVLALLLRRGRSPRRHEPPRMGALIPQLHVLMALAMVPLAALFAVTAYLVSPLLLPAAAMGLAALVVAFLRPVWGLMLAMLVLPLELYSLGVGTGALSASETLFAAVALGWMWRALARPDEVVRPRARDAPIVALLVLFSLGVASATDIPFVLRITFLWIGFYFIYLQVQSFETRQMMQVLAALGVSAGILGLIGAVEYLGGTDQGLSEGGLSTGSRAKGTFADANYYASLLVLAVLPALAIALADMRRYLWLAAAAFSGAAGVAFSFSRGALVGLAVGVLLLLRSARARVVAAAVIAVFAGLSAAGATPLENSQLERVEERLGTLSSGALVRTNRRPEIWRLAIKLGAEHPFVGVGARNFDSAAAANGLFERGEPLENVHNMWLNIAAENGVIAFLAFLAITIQWLVRSVVALRSRKRLERTLAIGLMAAMVGFLLQALTQSQLRVNVIAATFFVFGGMIAALADRARSERRMEAAAAQTTSRA